MKAKPKGSHLASPGTSVLIAKLVDVRKQQAALRRRAAVLTKMIKDRGCGSANGVRSYVAKRKEGLYCRYVRGRDQLVLVKDAKINQVLTVNT